MPKQTQIVVQTGSPKDITPDEAHDHLAIWVEWYFNLEDTSGELSRKEKRRALDTFVAFIVAEAGDDRRVSWTPRRSRAFRDWCGAQMTQPTDDATATRRWSARSINDMLNHLKPFARWVHEHAPFPLGNPMAKVENIPTRDRIDVNRAMTKRQEDDMLDAADTLILTGRRSKDRHRHRTAEQKPQRSDYRPYRNRAIVYTILGTGIRRSAALRLTVDDVDFDREKIHVIEKGGVTDTRDISREALHAIRDYLEHERSQDAAHFASPTLFLAASSRRGTDGRLSPRTINNIWNHVRDAAGLPSDKTPHTGRHRVGKKIMDKTKNPRAVQKQLGHRNLMYSMHYTNPTEEEMKEAINSR